MFKQLRLKNFKAWKGEQVVDKTNTGTAFSG